MLVATAAASCPTAEQGFERLASPDAEVAYRWDPAELRVGKFFAADVVACRTPGGEPLEDIVIDAIMPTHGHGMNYRPAATRTAAGHYRFTGLMLHMPGAWRIIIDLRQPGRRTRLSRDVKLSQ
jgi:hypothetical protein